MFRTDQYSLLFQICSPVTFSSLKYLFSDCEIFPFQIDQVENIFFEWLSHIFLQRCRFHLDLRRRYEKDGISLATRTVSASTAINRWQVGFSVSSDEFIRICSKFGFSNLKFWIRIPNLNSSLRNYEFDVIWLSNLRNRI